ncbi:hypothetical protein B9D92_21820, partial [Mycobacterium tuberculosis]
PTKSELGELDDAALEESRVDREFEYLAYDTTCLVEEDDEPPTEVDDEASPSPCRSPRCERSLDFCTNEERTGRTRRRRPRREPRRPRVRVSRLRHHLS